MGGPRHVRRRVPRVVPPRADGSGLPPRDGDDVAAAAAARRRGEALRRRRRGRRGPLVARLQPRGAPARPGLRRHDARGVRERRPAHRGDRGRPSATSIAKATATPPRPRPRHAPARAGIARHGRRGGRARVSQPRARAAEARRPLRRLGLDGGVLASARALPARARALWPRSRNLRLRHAAYAAHARADHPRPGGRPDGGLGACGRLVRRAPASDTR